MNSDEIKVCKSVSHVNGTELRRGPWTLEEDNLLIQYITVHGEGKWNTLSKFAGLNRTGKSCRLRWLNYLKPDIKRGNLTPQEQLLILELHSKLGNRWSKIAQHLPGRTDNEIKNYWRTRVQKQARQLKIDSNSKRFLEAIKNYWMPRLLEKIEQNSSLSSTTPSLNLNPGSLPSPGANPVDEVKNLDGGKLSMRIPEILTPRAYGKIFHASSEELAGVDCYHVDMAKSDMQELVGSHEDSMSNCHVAEMDWFEEDFFPSSVWDTDELWQLRKLEDDFVV